MSANSVSPPVADTSMVLVTKKDHLARRIESKEGCSRHVTTECLAVDQCPFDRGERCVGQRGREVEPLISAPIVGDNSVISASVTTVDLCTPLPPPR